jgi:predicted dehydrogenase
MAKDPVRVAAVGLGRWAKVLADAIKRSDRIRIVNCFSRSEKSREAFAQQYGCRTAKSYEELLDDAEVEAHYHHANDAHAEPIVKAAEKRKDVYVDKPIAHRLADAIAIDRACRKAGVILSVGHSARRLKATGRSKRS